MKQSLKMKLKRKTLPLGQIVNLGQCIFVMELFEIQIEFENSIQKILRKILRLK